LRKQPSDIVANGKLEAIQAPANMDFYQSMKRGLPETCEAIAEAGFDCGSVGIKAMRAALP
jgi:hypothetical protein